MAARLFFFNCSIFFFCLLFFQRFMHRNVVNLLTFNLDGSDISRTLLCTHIMLNWESKHQQHVCVQTETKPARSNQTFAAVSLSRDNDSVNSYHAGSRYLSSSLSFFCNAWWEHIRKEVAVHCFAILIIREMIFYSMFFLIIKNKIQYYCHGTISV